ncbi:uncharacterized protein [Bemisia tabaci]|uniref:uncharacterized protein n=1 Tax=Bemisia tabaci TaxID=7038 RepID=UPI003B286D0A
MAEAGIWFFSEQVFPKPIVIRSIYKSITSLWTSFIDVLLCELIVLHYVRILPYDKMLRWFVFLCCCAILVGAAPTSSPIAATPTAAAAQDQMPAETHYYAPFIPYGAWAYAALPGLGWAAFWG